MISERENRARVMQVFREGKSLWRAYMSAQMYDLHLESPVIDLGSGEYGTASYQRLIPGFKELDVVSVDISDERKPTKIADIEQGIPAEDGSFATCLNFNLLTLLYKYDFVLCESLRVLKPGGRLYFAVPFLMRVSPDPSDFFRFTGAGLERMLLQAGFSNIEVTALGAGAATAALAQLDFLVPRWLRGVVLRFCWWLDARITRHSGGKYRNRHDYPIGYFVTAQKP